MAETEAEAETEQMIPMLQIDLLMAETAETAVRDTLWETAVAVVTAARQETIIQERTEVEAVRALTEATEDMARV